MAMPVDRGKITGRATIPLERSKARQPAEPPHKYPRTGKWPEPCAQKNGRRIVFILVRVVYGDRCVHVLFYLDIAETTYAMKIKRALMEIKKVARSSLLT